MGGWIGSTRPYGARCHGSIIRLSLSASEPITRDEDSTRSARELGPVQVLIKQQSTMAESVKHMEESNALTAKRSNVLEGARERSSYTQPQNYNTESDRSSNQNDNEKQGNAEF